MSKPDQPHAAEWNPELVRRYWNWLGHNPYNQATYFSFRVGRGVVRFLADAGLLRGRVLDFGCGTGHLLKELLGRGLDCFGADSSDEAVARVNKDFSAFSNWHGAERTDHFATRHPNHFFDLIVCLETLEHLPPDSTAELFRELRRILKPGGKLFLTVPFAENLERETIYCPFCQSLFHRWQHMNSFSGEKLETLIAAQGFRVELCDTIDFEQFQLDLSFPRLTLLNLSNLRLWLRFRARRILDALMPRPFPKNRSMQFLLGRSTHTHLFAIAGVVPAGAQAAART
jgi:SAM-dependent methyltransferase